MNDIFIFNHLVRCPAAGALTISDSELRLSRAMYLGMFGNCRPVEVVIQRQDSKALLLAVPRNEIEGPIGTVSPWVLEMFAVGQGLRFEVAPAAQVRRSEVVEVVRTDHEIQLDLLHEELKRMKQITQGSVLRLRVGRMGAVVPVELHRCAPRLSAYKINSNVVFTRR
jgi:hypothetical protein